VRDSVPRSTTTRQEFTIPGKGTFRAEGVSRSPHVVPFRRGGGVSPREDPLRPESGPADADAGDGRAHEPHFRAVFDPANEVLKSLCAGMDCAPDLDSVDDLGVKHRVWRVTRADADPETPSPGMSGKGVFIADGHHRYETALGVSATKMRAETRGETPMRPTSTC